MKLFFLALTLVVSPGCIKEDKSKQLIIFHAGSLSMPLKKIAREFEKENKGVTVLLEAAGSRVCARKISELHRRADIMASADYTVIDTLLVPDHAAFTIPFAGNEMVIAYGKKSRRRDQINASNWSQILLDSEVAFGRSDPDSDPCGYRTVMVMKLSELHYKKPGLAKSLLQKDRKNIRPKETDLLALLEAGQIDYFFIY
ncbi:substrate-binding domain-containing protein, partial [Myxococcota bacterium]|nr:substrate-binding domain-containing protein [Myxococcota bacterium]MBU1534795.1 substrate-binding domain-containing protein [Myxococcota bacterium]